MAAKKITKPAAPAKVVAKSEVRNSPLPKTNVAPKPQTPAKKEITREMIARHAYFIWTREGGSEYDNWVRAERELRGL